MANRSDMLGQAIKCVQKNSCLTSGCGEAGDEVQVNVGPWPSRIGELLEETGGSVFVRVYPQDRPPEI